MPQALATRMVGCEVHDMLLSHVYWALLGQPIYITNYPESRKAVYLTVHVHCGRHENSPMVVQAWQKCLD